MISKRVCVRSFTGFFSELLSLVMCLLPCGGPNFSATEMYWLWENNRLVICCKCCQVFKVEVEKGGKDLKCFILILD